MQPWATKATGATQDTQSMEPTQPTQDMQTNRTHRGLRRWLAGALSEYRVGFTGYLETFHHGVWVCRLRGWLQVTSYRTNQLPRYLRAPVFLNQLPWFPVLLQKTTEFGIPQPAKFYPLMSMAQYSSDLPNRVESAGAWKLQAVDRPDSEVGVIFQKWHHLRICSDMIMK